MAEHLARNECSISDRHTVLVFPCKLEANPEKVAPHPNYNHHHDLTTKRRTSLKSIRAAFLAQVNRASQHSFLTSVIRILSVLLFGNSYMPGFLFVIYFIIFL